MRRKATSLVALLTFSTAVSGCSVHKTVQRPVGDYGAPASSSSETVGVRRVLTKAGEAIEFGENDLAFVIGGDVVSFEGDARLLTVRKADASFLTQEKKLVSIRTGDETYEGIRVVSETQQAITFVVAARPSGREIPLAEIDQLWVEEKGSHKAGEVVLAVVLVVGALLGIMAAIVANQWS